MHRHPVLLSWSGGKDAAWTLHVLRQRDDVDVVALLTTFDEADDRVAMQGIRRDVVQAQATAAGLPLLEARIPPQADNATYESRFAAALAAARGRWPSLSRIAFGDIFLADIRAWREGLCARLGWTPLFPIFTGDAGGSTALAQAMLAAGLRAHLCCVDTTQLDAGFAGRAFDQALLRDLPAAVDRCGERGEFHTCVSAGPMFDAALRFSPGPTTLRDGRFACTDFRVAAD